MDEESEAAGGTLSMVRVAGADRSRIWFDNGIELEMPCRGRIWSYLEFIDRVMVVMNIFDIEHCDQCRNIFCWRKSDGELLWQVARAVRPDGRECEGVYKYLRLKVRQPDGSYVDESEVEESLPEEILGMFYLKPFRVGVDRLLSMTWEDYPCEVEVDYETGSVKFLALHQKV